MQETVTMEPEVVVKDALGTSKTVVVDREFASRLKVFREKDGGFQRPLDKRRLPSIINAMQKGRVCPPIIVGDLRGEYYVLDGQHRLEAYLREPFPLKAEVYKILDLRDAARNFVEMNTNAKRVGLAMRLRVDPGEYATRLRVMCKQFNLTIEQGHNVMSGLLTYGFLTKGIHVSNKHWDRAKELLSIWTQDKRWGNSAHILAHPGVLRCVAEVTKDSEDLAGSLREIKTMDFSRRGSMARLVGGSHGAQKMMRQQVFEHLARKVI